MLCAGATTELKQSIFQQLATYSKNISSHWEPRPAGFINTPPLMSHLKDDDDACYHFMLLLLFGPKIEPLSLPRCLFHTPGAGLIFQPGKSSLLFGGIHGQRSLLWHLPVCLEVVVQESSVRSLNFLCCWMYPWPCEIGLVAH